MKRIKIACLGDSITKGTFSYDWIGQLRKTHNLNDYEFLNFGKNGDLAYNAYQRMDEVIAAKPDHIIILLGTNDVYATTTPHITRRYMMGQGLPEQPTKAWFAQNLEMIISRLKETTKATIGVYTLPVLGEDLGDKANVNIAQYNDEIRRIAGVHGIGLLDVHEQMTNYLKANPVSEPVPCQKNLFLLFKAAFRKFVLRQDWNTISERHGLQLTTDTIHLNETAGRMLADLAVNFVAGPEGSFFWPRPSAEMYERYRMQFSF